MITEIIENLNNSKTILYPTDTVWGLGCDATDGKAIEKIYQLKRRSESKSLIILVSSIEMLKEYVDDISEKAIDIIKESTKPTTIIYNNPKNLAKNAIASDNTIAIRIPKDNFCVKLIKEFGKPIISTSANISGEPTPKLFSEISTEILNNVDYVVDLHTERMNKKSSTILKIVKNAIIVLRA